MDKYEELATRTAICLNNTKETQRLMHYMLAKADRQLSKDLHSCFKHLIAVEDHLLRIGENTIENMEAEQ